MSVPITGEQLLPEYRFDIERRISNLWSGNKNALRSLLLVGARPAEGKYLSEIDTLYLQKFLRMCTEFRWPLSPTFSVFRTNIHEGMRNDFLQIDTPFDAVIFCYLFHRNDISANNIAIANKMRRVPGFYRQSPFHDEADRWHDRLLQGGTKVIGNIKSYSDKNLDLPNEWLLKDPYLYIRADEIGYCRKIHLMADSGWAPASLQILSKPPKPSQPTH